LGLEVSGVRQKGLASNLNSLARDWEEQIGENLIED
jgi:hypothetical protein